MYWARRVIAAVVAVVVIVAVVWWLSARGSEPDVDPAAAAVTGTTSLTGVLAPETTSPATGAAQSTMTTIATDATVKKTSADVTKSAATTTAKKTVTSTSASATKTTAPKTTTEKTTTSKTTTAKKTTATKSTPKKTTKKTTEPAPPKPSYDDQHRLICPDADIAVAAMLRSTTVPAGAQPRLGMTVTNTGSKPCVRDVSGSIQMYTVYTADGDRVWSTNDCFPGTGHEVRMLAPGSAATFVIKWSGTTSAPGCTAPRVPVKAGKYVLHVDLGSLKGKTASFTISG